MLGLDFKMMQSAGNRRYYTLAEANDALPLVRERAQSLKQLHGRVIELEQHIKAMGVSEPLQADPTEYNGSKRQWLQELFALVELYADTAEELEAMGVELKGLDPILIDFYSLLDGQTVYLCWTEGEETVNHFHTLHGGFASRAPVSGHQFTGSHLN